jgi:hypothetical protein
MTLDSCESMLFQSLFLAHAFFQTNSVAVFQPPLKLLKLSVAQAWWVCFKVKDIHHERLLSWASTSENVRRFAIVETLLFLALHQHTQALKFCANLSCCY